MAGKGGGAWKVAYADFVTAMMAFFLVMWITAQGKAVKEAVAGYFKDPVAYKANVAAMGKSLMPKDQPGAGGTSIKPLMDGLSPGGRGPGVKAKKKDEKSKRTAAEASVYTIHDGRRRIGGTVVQFGETSAELDERGISQLDELIPSVLGKRNKIEIRGHTTRKPMAEGGPYKDPWELSYARCLAVMRYLQKAKVEPERFRLSQSGPHEPQTLKVEPEWQVTNARVEVYVLSELTEEFHGTKKERTERIKQQ